MNDRPIPSETGEPPRSKLSNTPDASSMDLAKSSLFATFGFGFSRFSGLIRSQVLAAVFGASIAMDAFVAAFRLPNALRDLLAEGALSSAFTKTLVEARAQNKDAERRLIATITGVFSVVTLVLCVLGLWFAREIMGGITEESFAQRGSLELSIPLFQILVFFLPIAMLSALAMAILSILRKTFRATIALSFFNVGTVLGALALAPLFQWQNMDPILGLAVGTLLGGGLQFIYQVIPLARSGYFPLPRFSVSDLWNYAPLREILLLMAPRVVAQGATTLALLVNTYFASQIGTGALTFISNAQIIILAPVGLFGVAAGYSSMPLLSAAVQQRDSEQFKKTLTESLHATTWLSLWSMVPFFLICLPLCSLLFEHGKYTRLDVIQTALAVNAYSIALVFMSFNKVLTQGYYAFGDTKMIAWISCIALLANVALSALLVGPLGIVGLGLSSSMTSGLNTVLNVYFLKRIIRKSSLPFPHLFEIEGVKMGRVLTWLTVISTALGISGIFMTEQSSRLLEPYGFFEMLIITGVASGMIGMWFIIATRYWGPPPLRMLGAKILKRIRR